MNFKSPARLDGDEFYNNVPGKDKLQDENGIKVIQSLLDRLTQKNNVRTIKRIKW